VSAITNSGSVGVKFSGEMASCARRIALCSLWRLAVEALMTVRWWCVRTQSQPTHRFPSSIVVYIVNEYCAIGTGSGEGPLCEYARLRVQAVYTVWCTCSDPNSSIQVNKMKITFPMSIKVQLSPTESNRVQPKSNQSPTEIRLNSNQVQPSPTQHCTRFDSGRFEYSRLQLILC